MVRRVGLGTGKPVGTELARKQGGRVAMELGCNRRIGRESAELWEWHGCRGTEVWGSAERPSEPRLPKRVQRGTGRLRGQLETVQGAFVQARRGKGSVPSVAGEV